MYAQMLISQFWLILGPTLLLLFIISIMALLSCIHPRYLAAYPESSAPQVAFYVAPDGSDHNPGTEALPFATLERARDAIRETKHRSAFPKNGVTVWLRGGDYIRTKTFEFTGEDSGTQEAPIVWCAYPEERVRILGGLVITGFQPVTDESVRERLDETARDKVLMADLQSQGIQDYGILRSRGFGRPTTPAHGELFFGGLPMTLARWPIQVAGNTSRISQEGPAPMMGMAQPSVPLALVSFSIATGLPVGKAYTTSGYTDIGPTIGQTATKGLPNWISRAGPSERQSRMVTMDSKRTSVSTFSIF